MVVVVLPSAVAHLPREEATVVHPGQTGEPATLGTHLVFYTLEHNRKQLVLFSRLGGYQMITFTLRTFLQVLNLF